MRGEARGGEERWIEAPDSCVLTGTAEPATWLTCGCDPHINVIRAVNDMHCRIPSFVPQAAPCTRVLSVNLLNVMSTDISVNCNMHVQGAASVY